jgi:imidazolonepropionase-like amidohydrolase
VKLGADFIKIYSTGGVSTPGDGSDSLDFSLEETRAIVKEARRHGKRVATHAQGLEGIRIAVNAGVSTVEHGSWLDRETAVEMAGKGISLVTTIGIFRAILDKGEAYPNPESLAKAKSIIEAQSRMLELAREVGINLAMGTDASMSLRNGDNAREFLALSAEGLKGEDILRMATSNAALALGLENQIGSLEPGKRADFLLVEGSPLEEISCLTRKACIRAVARDGRFLCMRSSTGEEMISGAFSSDLVNEVLAG